MISARYTRTAFTPSDQCYGECRVYGPDGVTLIRTIPAATLRKRGDVVPAVHAPLGPARPSVRPHAPRPKRTMKPGQRDWIV